MRILGICPTCKAKDTIQTDENASNWEDKKKATCGECGQQWLEYSDLISLQKEIGNKLIPVLISVEALSVGVKEPAFEDIPCRQVIIMTLNVALMVRFKLESCFSCEGGLQGSINGEPIELSNMDEEIGLWNEYGLEIPYHPGCHEIFKWYEELLRVLFERELIFYGNVSYGRGEILKLSQDDPQCENKAYGFLWLALYNMAGNKEFAEKVFERMEKENGSPLGPFIRGLTDSEIVERFIPPPMDDDE